MTRKSKREIERSLDDLDAGSDELDMEDMWEWVEAVKSGDDIGRPPEYFPDNAEWADGFEQVNAIERRPELKHLTPPEVYALSYCPDETTKAVLDVLARSDDTAAEKWREAVRAQMEEDAE